MCEIHKIKNPVKNSFDFKSSHYDVTVGLPKAHYKGCALLIKRTSMKKTIIQFSLILDRDPKISYLVDAIDIEEELFLKDKLQEIITKNEDMIAQKEAEDAAHPKIHYFKQDFPIIYHCQPLK